MKTDQLKGRKSRKDRKIMDIFSPNEANPNSVGVS